MTAARRIRVGAFVVLLVFSLLAFAPARVVQAASAKTAALGTAEPQTRLVVRFEPATSSTAVADALASASASADQIGQIAQIGVRVLSVPSTEASSVIAALQREPDVAFAAHDEVLQVMQTPVTTNDPILNGSTWQFANTRINEAWQTTTGSAGVTVAVVDTGVNANHEDLSGQVLPGYDFVNNKADASDDFGHGTGVAGIIAAKSNNGVGITGVCPACKILPVKVLGADGHGYWSTVAQGITYAADQGARVINLSLGSITPDPVTQAAIAYAQTKGALVVAAAGNDGANENFYPAAFGGGGLVSVVAVDSGDQRESWSNYGNQYSLAAPGCTATTSWSAANLNNSYINPDGFCGTSIATPFVAGIAALAFSYKPSATNVQVATALEQSAVALPVAGLVAYGRVDAPATLAALGAPADPFAAPANTTAPSVGSVVAQVGWYLSMSPGTWTGTLPMSSSYTVKRCNPNGLNCVAVGSSPYLIAAADVGYRLTFSLTRTNAGGSAGKDASNLTNVIPPAGPTFTGTLTMSGGFREGQTVTASATAADFTGTQPITVVYSWRQYPSNVWISGAHSQGYTLTSVDIGKQMQAAVTAFDGNGNQTVVYSSPSVPVGGTPPSLNVVFAVSGTARVGETLSTDGGSWTGSPTFSYQWSICDAQGLTCQPLPGATLSSHQVSASELGLRLKVTVTATNSVGSGSADSRFTDAVVAALPPPPAPAPPTPPPAPTPPAPPAPGPSPPSGGGGGGGGGGGSEPDLSLEITTDTPPALNQGVTYRLRVYGKVGWGATDHAIATFTVPDQVIIGSVYLGHGPGCTQAGQTLTCDFDWVNPGQSVTAIVQGTVSKPGVLSAKATLWAKGELNLNDNQATLNQTVTDPTAAAAPTPGNPSTPSSPDKKTEGVPLPSAAPSLITVNGASLAPGASLTLATSNLHGTTRYQWQAAGKNHRYVNLASQTRATLKVTRALVGKQVRVIVSLNTTHGVRIVTSKATTPVLATPAPR
jgi:subtilisin family serine protease